MLWLLYAVQGLPFGYQATALPVLMREAGASLAAIGFAGLVSAPWMLKPLWAPWVDRSATRKSWLVPMQALLVGAVLLAGGVGDQAVVPLLAAVFLMNLFAATLDIAVDGLAVDMLAQSDLGWGNAAQVVGFKVGMLAGGGLVLWLSGRLGHRAVMGGMAGLIGVAMLVTWRFTEPARPILEASAASRSAGGLLPILHVWRTLASTFRQPAMGWLIVAMVTYKLGESVSDAMFKPWLTDAGVDRAQIGLWVGTWGMGFSLAGSLTGGWLASRFHAVNTLTLFAVLRVLPLAGQWWLTVTGTADPSAVIPITCAEHFFGGGLTTAMFALMMARVDRRIAATHYTALAALEVIGKAVPGVLSGVVTQAVGYPSAFGLAVGLSTLFLFVLPRLRTPVESAA
jgi:MFS family permease